MLDMMDNRQAVDHMTTLETDALTLAEQPFLDPFWDRGGTCPRLPEGVKEGARG